MFGISLYVREPLAVAHAGAFLQEVALYMDSSQPLGRFLPEMRRVGQGSEGTLRDTEGNTLPACVVMEKGEPLDTWLEEPGVCICMATGLQVYVFVAQCSPYTPKGK